MMTNFAADLSRSGRHSVRTIEWRGRSGHDYVLDVESTAGFNMADFTLYLIVDAEGLAWTGSLTDIIGDAQSRARFRAALRRATAVYSLPVDDALEALTAAWDIEGGEPVAGLSAA
jgi:hypothetical protein